MKVKVRRPFLGREGRVHRGDILDIPEERFRQLTEGIHRNNPLVDPVEVGFKMEPRPLNKMEPDPANKEAAKSGAADPTGASSFATGLPTGGPTGEASAASSLAPARRRRTRISRGPEEEPAA